METKKINLGRVGLVPKGAYSPDATYGRMHVVTYKNTTYWSKQEGNTGHEPNGEGEWWGILVDGQAAYAGAFNAMRATERANTAAEKAEQTNTAVWGAEQVRESAEEERKTAETQREEQAQTFAEAEQTRTDAEQRRAEAETQRVEAEKRRASEETLRAAAEDTRKSDEADRRAGETSREQQEDSRVAAEQTRNAQETQRKIDETKRTDAETKRAAAENTRKRMEVDRKNAETDRAAAETARVKAETARADAETKRATAETKRESDFSAKVTEVDTAVANAKTATSEAEKVDATITDANVFEVTGRDGVKKSLGLVGQAEADAMKNDVARIKESMGAYSDRPNITLAAKENNVAISADGVKVSKSGWAIAEFTAELGNIYLFNPGETSSDVCVFAEYIDKQEKRAIDYTYTYDGSGRVLTAKATYNGKTYTYTYDYTSSITSITDQDGNSVSSLPSVYTTTVGKYQPMTVLNANAELPVDGYCRFVSNFTTASAIKIVVSYKVSSADLTMKVVRDGSTANMCSQLAKINKKVDEVSERLPRMWINVCSTKDTAMMIDNKRVDLPAHKNVIITEPTVLKLVPYLDNIPDPSCIKRFDIHYNGIQQISGLSSSAYYMPAGSSSAKWYGLSSVQSLDVSGFDTSKVVSMSYMFACLSSVQSLDVSGFDTSKVVDMNSMFYNCASLQSLDVSGFDTSKVVMAENLFFGCKKLTSIDVSSWDVSNMKTMSHAFSYCGVTELDLSGWEPVVSTSLDGFFENCLNLTKVKGNKLCQGNVVSIRAICHKCSSLTSIDVSGWDLSLVGNVIWMFSGCNSLATLTFGEGFGKMKDECGTLDLSQLPAWKDDSVKSLLTLYDRKANGMGVITIKLHANAKTVLGEDGIAQLTAKGYTIA